MIEVFSESSERHSAVKFVVCLFRARNWKSSESAMVVSWSGAIHITPLHTGRVREKVLELS